MALIKKNYYVVAYFDVGTAAAVMTTARNDAIAKLQTLGFTPAQIKTRGPLDAFLFDANGDAVPILVGVVEVRP